MSRSIIKLVAIIAVIAGLLFIALYGLDFTQDKGFPGVLDPNGIVQGLDLKGGSVIVFEAQESNPTDEQMNTVANMMYPFRRFGIFRGTRHKTGHKKG